MLNIFIIYETNEFAKIVERTTIEDMNIYDIHILDFIKIGKEIDNTFFDNINCIVAETSEEMVKLLRSFLRALNKTYESKLINFYGAYNALLQVPKIQKIVSNPHYENVKGLIMGLSHAETGIISSMFLQNTCNIATGGQDIYYNLKSLEWCIKHHKRGLKDLETVIFDMYDYSYFNVDTSLGKNAINYYTIWDGYIWDKHNFDANSNFEFDFEKVKEALYAHKYKNVTEKEVSQFQKIFPKILELTNYNEYMDDYKVKNISKTVSFEELEAYQVESSIVTKIHDKTWEENEKCFEQILILLKKINPNIRIKIVLMPRCTYVEEKMKKYDDILSSKFYFVLNRMQKKYEFEVYDLKGLREISDHMEYYYDGEHLNRRGAKEFTHYFLENCM